MRSDNVGLLCFIHAPVAQCWSVTMYWLIRTDFVIVRWSCSSSAIILISTTTILLLPLLLHRAIYFLVYYVPSESRTSEWCSDGVVRPWYAPHDANSPWRIHPWSFACRLSLSPPTLTHANNRLAMVLQLVVVTSKRRDRTERKIYQKEMSFYSLLSSLSGIVSVKLQSYSTDNE